MYPDTIQETPATGGEYTPYFYASGLHRLYLQPVGQAPEEPAGRPLARYDFSSDPRPWQPSRQPQTVEQIISHGYFSIPEGEHETAIISDKKETSWLGLDDIISQVRQRHVLYQQNMYELDLGICEAQNAVFRQVASQGAPADNRQQYSASKAVQGLYEQKRFERVKLWQDVSKLKQTLPEAAQQYLSAYRKVSILEDSPGDTP